MDDTGRTGADVAAGIALLAGPVVAMLVKFVAPGWMTLIYLFGAVLALPVLALLVVLAATGFLTRRAAFAFAGQGRMRGRIAAWLHPAAWVAATALLVDGGDDGTWTSPLAVLFGQPPNSALAEAGNVLFFPLAAVSAAAFIWLVIEWVLALRARARAGTGA